MGAGYNTFKRVKRRAEELYPAIEWTAKVEDAYYDAVSDLDVWELSHTYTAAKLCVAGRDNDAVSALLLTMRLRALFPYASGLKEVAQHVVKLDKKAWKEARKLLKGR